MSEGYYEIKGTMQVPIGGHLSSAQDGSNYGAVLSDDNNQLMGQARFKPHDDDDDEYEDEYEYDPEDEESEAGISDKELIGLAVGFAIAGIGAYAYRKFRKHRQAKRLEDEHPSGRDTQQRDVAVAETTRVPAMSEAELNDEQKREMALLFLDLADAQRRLNNLVAQGLDASDVRSHIARMLATLSDCDPKELTDQVNRVIEQQHRETQNLALLLGRQPAADSVFQPVTWQDVELVLNADASASPERKEPSRWRRIFRR